MKKFIFALAGLCLLSIPGLADNNIKMVTYFPVPYVSYGDLTVTSTCDVGLLGSCNLDVGEGLEIFKSSSSNQALNTGSLIVRQGALSLNSSLASSSVNGSVLNVGSGEISGSLEFGHNLVVDQMAGNKVQSLEARNKAYLSGLTLFGEAFPVCDEANHEINWKKLTVNGKEGVFLVCGNGGEKEELKTCDDASYFQANLAFCCEQLLDPELDSRCYAWAYEEILNPHNSGSHSCSGGVYNGNWVSTGTNVSKCASYIEIGDPLNTCAFGVGPGGGTLCTDTREVVDSKGNLCYLEDVEWYCYPAEKLY